MARSQVSLAAKVDSLRRQLFAPVDISFLFFLRVAFGGIVLWEVGRYFAHGWISRYFIEPSIYFTYFGFGWVRPWPGDGMFLHFYGLGFLAVCILAGFCYRLAATLFFFGFTYVFLLDQTRYLNHFYFISLLSFLLIFLPAHRAFSIDVLLRPNLRSDLVPRWTLWLLRFQIGVVYFYGGLAKLNRDWLAGEPMRTWLAGRTDFPLIGSAFPEESIVYFFVGGGLLLDLLIVPLLLWKRTRWFAFMAAVAFHLLNARLFSIGIFPWLMLMATLVYFPPDFPGTIWRAARRLTGAGADGSAGSDRAARADAAARRRCRSSRAPKTPLVFLAIYAVVQLLVPLRHFAYPGDVNWTEEGHRFSWHMMLRTKSADAHFEITEPATGRVSRVAPVDYLGPRQLGKMVTHPEMILQFCHYLAEERRGQGYGPVEVRAQVMASLNGRKPQPLVDPTSDLAKEQRSLLPANWIMPLSEPLPKPGPAP